MTIATAQQIVDSVEGKVTPLDPMAPVIDFEKSQGAKMFDSKVNRPIIDFASHYASLPLGYNHPGFFEEDYEKELIEVSRVKIANLDVLSPSYQTFLETFIRVVGPKSFERFFFVDGGGLGVENTLKAAFDWKIRRNLREGKGEKGYKILHFEQAFHGRTGYTLSLTNTADPRKTMYFPKFDWPRAKNPKMRFPMEGENLEQTLADEKVAMEQVRDFLAKDAEDIAAILIEPIQGEGGDNHFRPEFLKFLRNMADEHDVLLIFDEVQTGMGMTGTPWAFQGLGVEPDLIAFAKKAQVGGFMAGPRLMEEEENVFTVPSRISSTWGGSLTDMVRCRKYLEICEEENLFENAAKLGEFCVSALQRVAEKTGLITNVRGRGLFMAFDLVQPEQRGKVWETCYHNGLMILPCGEISLRFRPHLNVTEEIIEEAVDILENSLTNVHSTVSTA